MTHQLLTAPAYDLSTVRTAFPITHQITYLNHASISPLPEPARQALHLAADELAREPASLFSPAFEGPLNTLWLDFNVAMATLINAAHPHEIVITTSTSLGLNTVAQSIDWQPGDNVVLYDGEFPSNVYPWMALARRGVETRLAPSPTGGATVDAFAPLVDARTRVIAASAIQFFNGHRADLAALGAFCRERGILFVVDAIQAAGHIPLDVQAMQIDILSSGGQKSLMGPPGQGFVYVRDEICQQMQPALIGPNATEGWEHWLDYDLTPRPDASRFMLGTPNLPGMAALVASVRFLRELGIDHIDAWTRHLSQLAIDQLARAGFEVITPRDNAQLGPIVTFRYGDADDCAVANSATDALMNHLAASGFRLTKHLDAAGWPHVRISSHCYNTEDDIRHTIDAIKEFRA